MTASSEVWPAVAPVSVVRDAPRCPERGVVERICFVVRGGVIGRRVREVARDVRERGTGRQREADTRLIRRRKTATADGDRELTVVGAISSPCVRDHRDGRCRRRGDPGQCEVGTGQGPRSDWLAGVDGPHQLVGVRDTIVIEHTGIVTGIHLALNRRDRRSGVVERRVALYLVPGACHLVTGRVKDSRVVNTQRDVTIKMLDLRTAHGHQIGRTAAGRDLGQAGHVARGRREGVGTEPDHGLREVDTEHEAVRVSDLIRAARARVRSRLESHFVGHGCVDVDEERLVVGGDVIHATVAGHGHERTPVGPVYDALVQGQGERVHRPVDMIRCQTLVIRVCSELHQVKADVSNVLAGARRVIGHGDGVPDRQGPGLGLDADVRRRHGRRVGPGSACDRDHRGVEDVVEVVVHGERPVPSAVVIT